MTPDFDLTDLRRYPDVEAPNLVAVDATDRLLLDTAAPYLQDPVGRTGLETHPGRLTVIGDHYGALTLGAAGRFGATGIRTHQDPLTGELALRYNADRLGLTSHFRSLALTAELVEGADLVLIQAPKSLPELAELTELIAEHADPDVRILLGGRLKYLTPAMNEVLAAGFTEVRAGLARQKSRVITARGVRAGRARSEWPRREWHEAERLWVCAHGGAFAGTSIDIGTRRLLPFLDELPDADTVIDLGCGTGVLAVLLARAGRTVLASDQSAAACASTRATAAANGVAVTVERDDALSGRPPASARLIVCNPPFHLGGAVHAGAAHRLFRGAARVLGPGGELWTVFNRHLDHRAELQRLVGPTRVVHQDAKFTVTATVRAG